MSALRIPEADLCECGHTLYYHDSGGCQAPMGVSLEYDCACPEFQAVGRLPDGLPALTSGCESPDPSPGCPRCAALTREGEEFFRYVHDVLLPARDELMANAEAKYVALSRERDEAQASFEMYEESAYRERKRAEKAERDLAQARQALKKATWDLACFTFKGKDISLGEEADALYAAFSSQPLAAREALGEQA